MGTGRDGKCMRGEVECRGCGRRSRSLRWCFEILGGVGT